MFVGPFSREFFLASARCRQLDMKATDPKLHVCKATAPCTESVFHLCYTSGAAETVRAKKKGVMARSSWGRWNAGLCVSMCSWGTDLLQTSRTVLQLQFGAVRCISAACNFACSTCFSHQAESVKIDSPRFFRYLMFLPDMEREPGHVSQRQTSHR